MRVKQVGCVVMASGISERFGGNKLLAPLRGKALLMHTLEKLKSLPLAQVVVVSPQPEVKRMTEEMGFLPLSPDGPDQRDTIRAGVQTLSNVDGCLFCVGDQPLCTAQSMLRVLQAFDDNPERICRLYFGDQPGNPVLFPAALFSALANLPQGKGGSWLIHQHPGLLRQVQAEDAAELEDVDTPDKLAELELRLQNLKYKS